MTEEKLFVGMMGMVVICFAIVFIIIGLAIYSAAKSFESLPDSLKTTEVLELRAFSLSQDLGGRFFLGTGSIESVPYYFFYYQLDEGGMMLGKARACSSIVYEVDDNFRAVIKKKDFIDRESVTFFVPHNSIVQNFNADLRDL